jgi:hypothetical protein
MREICGYQTLLYSHVLDRRANRSIHLTRQIRKLQSAIDPEYADVRTTMMAI